VERKVARAEKGVRRPGQPAWASRLSRVTVLLVLVVLVGSTAALADTAPVNTVPPTIDGLAAIGQTLHASPGTWTGTSPTFSYQWQDCGNGATYAGEVNADTPTAYWRLGESAPATTAVDEKGGANGTYAGTPALGASGLLSAPGETNTAVSFDGVNDLVSTPLTNSSAQLAAFSLEAWVKRNGAPAATQTIAAANGTFLRIAAGASTASFGFWNGSSSQVVSTTVSVVDNAAHHVVGTWDGTTLRIYLDGALSSFLVPTGTPSAQSDAFTIGDAAGGTSWFAGTIDEVAFYRAALGATRVKAHFDRGRSGCTDIAGATGQDFIVPESAAGHSYRVVVTATNLAGSASAASARTSTVTLSAPSNDVQPTVDGTYAQGQTLTGSDGQWSGSLPITFSHAWLRCGYFQEVTGLSPAPTSYWRLSDLPGTTTAVDSSGNGHNGAYHHYPTMGVPGALNGDPNPAVSFNGSDNYLSDTSNAYPTGSAAASVSFWFITPRMPSSGSPTTVLAGYPGFQVKLAPLGKLQINSIVSPTVLSANTWYHVVAVDPGGGGALKLYVNGQLDALTGNASAAKAGGEFDVGGSSTTATLTTIDDVAAFPSALSATQAQSLYSAGINESPPDGCTAISGAAATTYQVQQADEQSKLSYQVTAQNSVGSASASSPEHIVRSPGPSNLDPPMISGTPTVGQALTVSNGGWDGSPTGYAYQWERCGYRPAVLADQPLGYWRFGDVAQKFVGDSSGNNNTGTYGAGISGVPGALRGDGDGAFTGGTVSIPSSGALTPTGAFSVEEWLKPSSDSLPIITLAKEGGDWSLQLNANKARFDVQNASFVHSTATSSVTLTDAAHWYHVVAVFTGTQSQVYVDGVQRGTGANISGRVRTDFGGPLTFDGTAGPVDEAAFYTTPNGLSSAQITAHLNAAPCTDITGAVAQSYTLTAADSGKWLSAIVTAQNGQGSSSASSTTTLVGGSTAPINTVRPAISDPAEDARQVTNPNAATVQIGDVLSATDGSWTPGSGLTFTRQWQRCGYAAAVLLDNPAGYWPLNEPAGPRADDVTGNNNDGTYGGAPLFGVDGALADGADTGIRVSDRADNVTTAASASLDLATVFTVEAWVRRNTADGQTLFDKGQAGIGPTDDKGLIFKIGGDGTLSLGQSLGNTIAFSSPGAVPKDGHWHYVVGTDTGNSTGHLYVDGVSVPATTDNTQVIAHMPNNGLTMAKGVGDVDELAIYPTALSATRIQAHYTAGQAPCTDITGANGTSYAAAAGDVSQSLRIKVTASGTGGTTIAASNGSDPVVQQGGLALDSPHDGATVRTTTPTLAMVPVANNATTQYEFEAATDALFTDNRQNSGWLPAGNPTFTVPATWKVKDGQIWYWHARTKSASGTVSPWTTVWSFHVQVNVLGAGDTWSMTSFGALSVNKLNGNLLVTAPTPSYPTSTSALSATFIYNSLSTKSGNFGKGWTDAGGADGVQPPTLTDLNLALQPQDAVQVDWPDGQTTIYGHVAGSADYRSPPGDNTHLYKNDDGSWTLTTPAGDVYSYGTDLNISSYQSTSTIPGQAPLTFTYTSGKPTRIADPSGRALTFTWHSLNATGCPSAILCLTGPDGITWQYVGSGAGGTSGALARINDGVRDVFAIGYDGSGRINKIQNANDLNPGAASPGYDLTHSIQIGYDGNSRVSSIDNGPIAGQTPSHSIWTFAYSMANVQTDPTRASHSGIAVGTQRTAVSSTTVYQPNQYGAPSPVGTTTYYDEFNHPIEIKDPLGHYSLSGYTLKGQPLWSEDANGIATDNTYDPVTNQLTAVATPDPSSSSGTVTTRHRYDEASIGTGASAGQPTPGLAGTYFKNKNRAGRGDAQRTDATVDFNWGSGGPTILGGQSDNFSIRWTGYLNVGQTGDYVLSTVADGGTSVVVDGYTSISDINASGLHTKSSQSIHLKAGLHPITLGYSDTTGSAEVHLRWRCAGCPTPISTQVIPASALRPDYGNQTSLVTPSGAVAFSHYAAPWRQLTDYSQRQISGTDIITSYRYDAYARLIQKVMPKGNAGRTINADGDLTGPADATYATSYTYYGDTETAAPPTACGGGSAVAQSGQLKSTTPYGIHPTSLVYDIAGHVIASTNGIGTTCSAYDNEGRLAQRTAPGESQPTIYSYDPSGAVRSIVDASGTVTYAYDEGGRISASTDSYGAQSAFSFDGDGNVVTKQEAKGAFAGNTIYTTTYGYDSADELQRLTDPAGRIYSFFYTAQRQPKATQYPNGTFSWNDYNRAGEISGRYNRHGTLPGTLPSAVPADSLGSPIADYAYAFNVDGKVTQTTQTAGGQPTQTSGYGYDSLGRLATASLTGGISRVYTYDKDSNRTAVSQNGNTIETYAYQPAQTAGVDELTSITRSGVRTDYTYTSDGEAKTRGADTLNWDGRGRLINGTFSGHPVSYGFDAVGRVRSRSDSAGTRRYLFAGSENDLITDGAGTITAAAVSSLAVYAGPPTQTSPVQFTYYNAHGDTVALADSSGARTAAYTYDPFGAVSGSSPDALHEQWLGSFAKRQDETSGLVDLGARSYDPATGRFLSVDPVDGGSLNLYECALQDPINNTDLTGRSTEPSEGGGRNGCSTARVKSYDIELKVHWCWAGGTITTIHLSLNTNALQGVFPEPPGPGDNFEHFGENRLYFYWRLKLTWHVDITYPPSENAIEQFTEVESIYVNGYGQWHEGRDVSFKAG
jgi:RHS repeat-associated protein